MARICREAGLRVTIHTRVAIRSISISLERVKNIEKRTEVIPDGLPLCGGGRCKLHQTPSRPNHWNTCPHRNRSCWTAVFSHASPLDRFRYFNAVVTPVACFGAAHRKACKQDLCKVFRRLLRSIVRPPADVDYGMKSFIIGTKD